MRQRGFGWILFAGFLLSVSPFLVSGNNYKVVNGPQEFYFGHISLADIKNDGKDPLVFREGAATPEVATMNLPLGPGDTIKTSDERRCEIEFDNGTILRLDINTELKIETLMAQTLSSRKKVTNLVLRKGRIYAMYKEYNTKEVFQVITPGTAVMLKHNTVAMVEMRDEGSSDVQVKYGKATILYGADPKNLQERIIYKNEKLTLLPDQTFIFGEYLGGSDFETWNDTINEEFVELHKGKSVLPKPIQRLPAAVYYFAQKYGNIYGEWIYDDMYGYVWRPFYNDYYPWGSWQPYVYGRWANFSGQMYWVPQEPWGWIPYHLGVWHWDKNKGWMWLPGSAFAPAWVDWAFFGGSYFAWRPWMLWDWMWYSGLYGSSYFDLGYYAWRYPNYYYYGSYFQGGGDVSGEPAGPQVLTKISKNQLQKPANPPFAMPKELKGAYKSLLQAVINGDEGARASLQAISKHAVVVGATDLNAPRVHDKAVKLEAVLNMARALPAHDPHGVLLNLPPLSFQTSLNSAARSYDRSAQVAELKNHVISSLSRAGAGKESLMPPRALPSAVKANVPLPPSRIHDWNPDARIARQLGVNIMYFSRLNQVYCPQLNISSSMAHSRPAMTSGGLAGHLGGDSSGSGGSAQSGGSASTSGSSGSSSGGSTSSGGGGGGHIRN